jgi:glycosidase
MKRSQAVRRVVLSLTIAIGFVTGCSRKEDFAISLNDRWLSRPDPLEKGVEEKWFRKGFNRSDWQSAEIGRERVLTSPPTPSGARWYATDLAIESVSKPLTLFFGAIEDEVDVWLDGRKIASAVRHGDPYSVDLPAGITRGKMELVLRVSDNGAMGSLYEPVSLVPTDRLLEMYKTGLSDETARSSEEWVRDAVIYEVYLRSFSRYGGFKALERRLSELKALGVGVIWLMPIHPAGELYRKGTLGSPYSIQDYYAINPEFGTMDDFKSLIGSVHSSGMKINIDLVAGHTAWDSKTLMEHPEWYVTNEEGAITSPNPIWSDVAKLNYGHHELRKYMIEMMKYWVRDIGIDGFRCDAAKDVPTDFWEHARSELDKIKPVMMLSEGALPEHQVKAFDITYSWTVYDALSTVIDGNVTSQVFDDILKTEGYQFPKGSLRLRFNTNHDKNAWDAPAVIKFSPKGARTTAVLSFTYPGVPLIYNGEEAGNEKKLSLFEKVEIDWTKNLEFRAFYQVLAALRSSHIALRRGDYVPVVNSADGKVLTFVRQLGNDQVLVVLNLSRDQRSCEVAVPMFKSSQFVEYFTKTPVSSSNGHLSLDMKGLDYKVFLPTTNAGRGIQ